MSALRTKLDSLIAKTDLEVSEQQREQLVGRLHAVSVVRRANVGRTGKGDLVFAESECISSAAFNQRQCLYELCRRPRIHQGLWITPSFDDTAVFVTNHRMSAMNRFQNTTPPNFGQIDSTTHISPFFWRPREYPRNQDPNQTFPFPRFVAIATGIELKRPALREKCYK